MSQEIVWMPWRRPGGRYHVVDGPGWTKCGLYTAWSRKSDRGHLVSLERAVAKYAAELCPRCAARESVIA